MTSLYQMFSPYKEKLFGYNMFKYTCIIQISNDCFNYEHYIIIIITKIMNTIINYDFIGSEQSEGYILVL